MYLLWEQGVAGSNPATPTRKQSSQVYLRAFFFYERIELYSDELMEKKKEEEQSDETLLSEFLGVKDQGYRIEPRPGVAALGGPVQILPPRQ